MKENTYDGFKREWDYEKNGNLKPEDLSAGSNKKVWWKCERGHEWEAIFQTRVKGAKCPYCSGKKAITGETDIFSVHPDLEDEWNYEHNIGLNPKEITAYSNKKVWWKCKKHHEWQATVNKRGYGRGCPFCAGQEIITGENDLASLRPDLVPEWNFKKNGMMKPENVFVSSNKKVWWICGKGHEWQATINNRNSKNSGCPYCSGRMPIQGETDLKTLNPQLAEEWNNEKNCMLTPDKVKPGSNKKVYWKCRYGHEWCASINDRNNGNGCPYCAGQKIIVGETDLATTNPILASEWNTDKNINKSPSDFKAGSNVSVWWICENGHEWYASINSRNQGAGCPYCAGQNPIFGKTDLTTVNPELVKEWNYIKNGNQVPENMAAKSVKKVWWICSNGHEWQAVVGSRSAGRKCPYCTGKKVVAGVNDLFTLNPDFLVEWDYEKNVDINPNEVSLHSHKKVWWKCNKGHEWKSAIDNRSRGATCPYCSGHKKIKRKH